MTSRLTRRELVAWLAAGSGAIATGSLIAAGGDRSSTGSPRSTAPPSEPAVPSDTSAPSLPTTAADGRIAEASTESVPGDRLLVVVELPGGNDGLSTVVPYASGRYHDVREATLIPEDEVLTLDDEIGLHPELVGLHRDGVAVVEGVGSTRPDGSHFEMQQRWWAGSSVATDGATGWIGRLGDALATPDAPTTVLSVGSGAHPIIRSRTNSGLSMPDADAVWAVAGAEPDDELRAAYQRALRSFTDLESPLRTAMTDGFSFADQLVDLSLDEDDADGLGYEGWGLGRSLQFAASVFTADVGIRVVHARTEGDYDTHDGHAWKHPGLMRELDANLAAFRQDIARRGLADRVVIMTTSEFGRTFRENGSGGLDHGTSSTMLITGPGMAGRHGEAPSYTDLDDNDDLRATVPVESYLGGVVQGWLGVPADEVVGSDHEPLDLV
ncbi:MAG: DUF1501 domain-containing protein [Actinomycetota bacterium]